MEHNAISLVIKFSELAKQNKQVSVKKPFINRKKDKEISSSGADLNLKSDVSEKTLSVIDNVKHGKASFEHFVDAALQEVHAMKNNARKKALKTLKELNKKDDFTEKDKDILRTLLVTF